MSEETASSWQEVNRKKRASENTTCQTWRGWAAAAKDHTGFLSCQETEATAGTGSPKLGTKVGKTFARSDGSCDLHTVRLESMDPSWWWWRCNGVGNVSSVQKTEQRLIATTKLIPRPRVPCAPTASAEPQSTSGCGRAGGSQDERATGASAGINGAARRSRADVERGLEGIFLALSDPCRKEFGRFLGQRGLLPSAA